MAARIHLAKNSPRSTVALAQTCRALGVPPLSALWEIQSSIKLPIAGSRVREWELSEDITRRFVPASSNLHPFLLLTLRELDWQLNETNASFVSTFLSLNLTKNRWPSISPQEG